MIGYLALVSRQPRAHRLADLLGQGRARRVSGTQQHEGADRLGLDLIGESPNDLRKENRDPLPNRRCNVRVRVEHLSQSSVGAKGARADACIDCGPPPPALIQLHSQGDGANSHGREDADIRSGVQVLAQPEPNLGSAHGVSASERPARLAATIAACCSGAGGTSRSSASTNSSSEANWRARLWRRSKRFLRARLTITARAAGLIGTLNLADSGSRRPRGRGPSGPQGSRHGP